MPANQIKHDVKEGKGTKKSLEKKWDRAKKAAGEGKADDKWALTNYIYQKMRDASVQPMPGEEEGHEEEASILDKVNLNAATRLTASLKVAPKKRK
jgi:hypothetical protein